MIVEFLQANCVLLSKIGVALAVVTYAFFKWKFSYWQRRGVPTLSPSIPFGDSSDLFLGKAISGQLYRRFYNEFRQRNEIHGGIYSFGGSEIYVPVDLEMIKHILQKDFEHFMNHGLYYDEKQDPLAAHLFNLENEKWKNMRVKLTPTFTSGKMKMMFQTLANCAVGLEHIVDDAATTHTAVEIKDILARYTTDVIGSAAFGLECNSLKDPDAEFRKYGRQIFEIKSKIRRFILLLKFILPNCIVKHITLKLLQPEVENFFMDVIRKTVNYREQNDVHRKDFMHLLIQLKNRGTVADDGKIKDGKIAEAGLTFNELAAQSFIFFVAGFETSSTLMSFALYELSVRQEIQDKLRDEINKVLKKHNGEITYDSVMEMKYLEQVLYEALRKYPPVPVILRECNKDYNVPGTSVIIPAGVKVMVPVLGIHHDPEYYPDPENFDPDRFNEENKAKRPNYAFLPFGDGPRVCIGLRFGMMQSKVGLITLLKNHKVTMNKKTLYPPVYTQQGLIMSLKGGVWLEFENISNQNQ